jgi:hypothetical protein
MAMGAASSVLGRAHPVRLRDGGVKYGPLRDDPDGVVMLPENFQYRLFSKAGEVMNDGFLVPGSQDGMAAFPGKGSQVLLVRNHELAHNDQNTTPFDGEKGAGALSDEFIYGKGPDGNPVPGGTTTLVYDLAKRELVHHHLSLVGTDRNCAGGRTPWNTWISCEEPSTMVDLDSYSKKHGFCFEIDPAERAIKPPKILAAMGRFRHEAIAVDVRSGYVYLTEDRQDSLLYRYIPDVAGDLARGGRLQALAVDGTEGLDTRNHEESPTRVTVSSKFHVRWIDMDRVDSPKDDLRIRGRQKGAAIFSRGEGIDYDSGTIFFACTEGGSKHQGQIWRLVPDGSDGKGDGGSLELFLEPDDSKVMSMCDNICVAPNGDLIIAEDGTNQHHRILGVTPNGQIYPIAKNVSNSAEVAGCTFSPDGSTLFFNIYRPGATVAVTGPWG